MRCPRCSEMVATGIRTCPRCLAALAFSQITTEPMPRASALPSPDLHEAQHSSDSFPLATDFPPFHPGFVFCERFLIIEKISEGGMGVVYKAHDRTLSQDVALKLIQPDLASVPSFVDRFKREVRITRQITHPNVCRVHDLGVCDGLYYLSMQWIHGETIEQILQQARRIDSRRALEIVEKIALALEAAHARGVVHRDLKPSNVMIDDHGEVFVMDFGIATEGGSNRLTTSGSTPGSPLYMAPEQRWGREVDGRADLYALGLILQQMVTGEQPHREADGNSHIAPIVDMEISRFLEKLLAYRPENRPASARHCLDEIGKLKSRDEPLAQEDKTEPKRKSRSPVWAGVGLGICLVLLSGYLISRFPETTPSESRTFYERGLHYLREEAETPQSLDQAIHMFHRSVGADSTQALAWAALGEAYWTRYDRFDRNTEAPSRPAAERAVNRAFGLSPQLPEARNARARGWIAQGRYAEARDELRRALDKKPRFDAAWANQSRALQGLGNYAEGLAAIEKAVQLNQASFRNWIMLGNFHQRAQEYDEAEKAYRKAVALKPESPLGWRNLGACLLYQNKAEPAADALSRSLRIEENARSRTNLGTAYLYLRHFGEAATQFQRATELEPDNPDHWGALGDVLTLLGRSSEANKAYVTAIERGKKEVAAAPLDALRHGALADWCAKAGDLTQAMSEANEARRLRPDDVHVLFWNAVVCCLAGRDAETLELLEKASQLGLTRTEIVNEPAFTRLARDPRFQRILGLTS